MSDLDIQIGTTLGGMVTVVSLSLPLPDPTPVHYSARVQLGNGGVLDAGWKQCAWRFDTLTIDELQTLLSGYCPSGSTSTVYIKTVNQGGGLQVYSATMIWPLIDPTSPGKCYEDVYIEFRELIEVST
jgi:hypothetical protein